MSDSKVVSVVERQVPAPAMMTYTFEQMRQMSVSFAKSGMFGVKDADQAFSLLMYGQALGKHPALIMMDYDLINNRLAKKSNAILRDFQRSGGRVEWVKYADDECIAIFTHPLSVKPVTIDWNMARAKTAGLADKNGGMYTKFTRAMFRSRCISEGVRTCAPDATEGLYTPEEVAQMEAEPTVVSETQAVAEAVAHVQSEMPRDEVDALIDSLDVGTLAELSAAFESAWKATKGNTAARARIKAAYDDMKAELEP